MQAVVVREGGVLSHETRPDPVPGPGEVLVELRAAALNRRDLLVRSPPGPAYEFELPVIPGSDGAGIRRDTGDEVVIFPSLDWGLDETAPGPGFRILGGPDDGTYAELIAIPAENVYPKPRRLSFEESAAFPLAALTAYRALYSVGELHSRHTVLVLGAGSGVTTLAVQLAAHAGARVLVTSSSDEKIARARDLGAAGGVRYDEGDWVDAVRELAPEGVDLVLDSVGSTWQESLRCLRRGGRAVVYGGTGGPSVELDVRQVYLNWLSLRGTTMGSARDFAGLLRVIEGGGLDPVIDSIYPLDDAEAAHDRLRGREHFGKIVLGIG
jgi:NADPH:quinone reductase-like Zn-dependent oxidoreductase